MGLIGFVLRRAAGIYDAEEAAGLDDSVRQMATNPVGVGWLLRSIARETLSSNDVVKHDLSLRFSAQLFGDEPHLVAHALNGFA